MMQYKIGIYGSAVLESDDITAKARELGKALSNHDLILITGAGKGLPYQVVAQAKKINPNIHIWGFPPVLDQEELKEYTADDISIYDTLTYIPKDFPFANSIHACRLYRNAISTGECDAGIIISGRWGTLNEFTNLQEGGKIIGVFTGTGGVADELKGVVEKVNKQNGAMVCFDSNPDILISKVIAELDKRLQK